MSDETSSFQSATGQVTREDDDKQQTLENERRNIELQELLLDLRLQRLDLQEKRVELEIQKAKLTANDKNGRIKRQRPAVIDAMHVLQYNTTMNTEASSTSTDSVEYEVDSTKSSSSSDSNDQNQNVLLRRRQGQAFSSTNKQSLSSYFSIKENARSGGKQKGGLVVTSTNNSSENATWKRSDESSSLASASLEKQMIRRRKRKTKRSNKNDLTNKQADESQPCVSPSSFNATAEKLYFPNLTESEDNESQPFVLSSPLNLKPKRLYLPGEVPRNSSVMHDEHSAPTERITGSSQRKIRSRSLSPTPTMKSLVLDGIANKGNAEAKVTGYENMIVRTPGGSFCKPKAVYLPPNDYFDIHLDGKERRKKKKKKKRKKTKRRPSLDTMLTRHRRSHNSLNGDMESLCYSDETNDPLPTPHDGSELAGSENDGKAKKKKKRKRKKKKKRAERRHTLG